MKSQPNNPWAARFEPLLDRNTLKKRATVSVSSLQGLRAMSTELACSRLETALNTVFHPTAQCIEILHRFVDSAYAHCVTTYPDSKTFLKGVYSQSSPLPDFSFPILLTGLAGTGKSQLMKAFRRIQMGEQSIVVDEDHSPFTLKESWQVAVNVRNNPKDILRTFASAEGGTKNLIDQCKRLAFRDGIPFLIADEFQFATTSEKANALLTQMLLSLGFIGIPWVYNANFSLVRRLLKRPEEDLQRLLANSIVLQPDSPSSEDWIRTLQVQQEVAKDILTFNPITDAHDLHILSAGRKRAMVKLLVLSLRNEHPKGGSVDLAAIKRAYQSPGFANYREEAEILSTQAIQNKPQPKRLDLWCPLPLPPEATAVFSKAATDQRNERVADAELESSLNKEEREALKAIRKATKKTVKPTGDVIPIRRNAPPTADELKQNTNWFKDQI